MEKPRPTARKAVPSGLTLPAAAPRPPLTPVPYCIPANDSSSPQSETAESCLLRQPVELDVLQIENPGARLDWIFGDHRLRQQPQQTFCVGEPMNREQQAEPLELIAALTSVGQWQRDTAREQELQRLIVRHSTAPLTVRVFHALGQADGSSLYVILQEPAAHEAYPEYQLLIACQQQRYLILSTRCGFPLLYGNAFVLGSDHSIAHGALAGVDIDDTAQLLQQARLLFPQIAASESTADAAVEGA